MGGNYKRFIRRILIHYRNGGELQWKVGCKAAIEGGYRCGEKRENTREIFNGKRD
jgi:hypothetical protein